MAQSIYTLITRTEITKRRFLIYKDIQNITDVLILDTCYVLRGTYFPLTSTFFFES